MAAIGRITDAVTGGEALHRARQRAALLPDPPRRGARVSASVATGWHGRRRRGTGENFWQFRPFVDGEQVSRIDWRRSARDDNVYLRDREWEAAQTVWLWADPSASMLYQSSAGLVSKESRALVLVLALAELLARSGERIGYPDVLAPVSARNAAERIAAALQTNRPAGGFPATDRLKRFSEIVLVGDFLDPIDDLVERIDRLAKQGVRGHIVQVPIPPRSPFPIPAAPSFRTPRPVPSSRPGAPKPCAISIATRSSAAAGARRALPAARLEPRLPRHRPPGVRTPRRGPRPSQRSAAKHEGARLMGALSFGAPLVLAGLLALPAIWWLLRLTPPRPQTETFPPLRILERVLRREETPARSPWWLTLLRLLLRPSSSSRSPHRSSTRARARSRATAPVVVMLDNGWASARDWDDRRAAAEDLIREAARPGGRCRWC